MSDERKSYAELADVLEAASNRYHGNPITHVKTGKSYRIVGVHFRESDMAVCVEYTPIRSRFHNRVKFSRSIEEMNFGTRFVFEGAHVGSLDAGAPNHHDHSKRGFDPK